MSFYESFVNTVLFAITNAPFKSSFNYRNHNIIINSAMRGPHQFVVVSVDQQSWAGRVDYGFYINGVFFPFESFLSRVCVEVNYCTNLFSTLE
jgi:hypothetical protein